MWVRLCSQCHHVVGSVGDPSDCGPAESQVGVVESGLLWRHGPWRERDHLEAAILDWVSWFNTVLAEQLHYRYRAAIAEAG